MALVTKSTLVLAALVSVVGCSKPHEGGKCKVSKELCVDMNNALLCKDSVYVKVPCRGPKACIKESTQTACDQSVAAVGDRCTADYEPLACSENGKQSLVCRNGAYIVLSECRGEKGCTPAPGAKVTCDQSKAVRGEKCVAGAKACTPDGKHVLSCKGGSFDIYRYCRGKGTCQTTDFECNESIVAEIGDPCDPGGRRVCAVDGMNELVCRGGRFEFARLCHKGCAPKGAHNVVCSN